MMKQERRSGDVAMWIHCGVTMLTALIARQETYFSEIVLYVLSASMFTFPLLVAGIAFAAEQRVREVLGLTVVSALLSTVQYLAMLPFFS